VLVKGACLLPSALCAASTKPFIMARKITLRYQANHITANLCTASTLNLL
jgi:hypothetical protein